MGIRIFGFRDLFRSLFCRMQATISNLSLLSFQSSSINFVDTISKQNQNATWNSINVVDPIVVQNTIATGSSRRKSLAAKSGREPQSSVQAVTDVFIKPRFTHIFIFGTEAPSLRNYVLHVSVYTHLTAQLGGKFLVTQGADVQQFKSSQSSSVYSKSFAL